MRKFINEKEKLILIMDHDDDFNPRRDQDRIGKMICFHKRYNLGDKHDLKSSSFQNWDEVEEYIKTHFQAEVILPIYMIDHSGLSVSTEKFSCPWDSGQIGFIYISKDDFLENFENKLDLAKDCLNSEIQEYDSYLRGDIYFYKIKDSETMEIIDSCYGFIGSDPKENGIFASVCSPNEINDWQEIT